MAVNTLHPEYTRMCPKWDLVRSIVENEAKHLIRTVDKQDKVRSEQYKNDAILTNFTRLTKIGLTGLVFRKEPRIELPVDLEYLKEDCTGYKFGLEQFSQYVVGQILETGRLGILVDYPLVAEGEQGHARLKPYTADAITNWKYTDYSSEYRLSIVTLKEKVEKQGDDIFDFYYEDQYRALVLMDGVYHQMIFNKDLELTQVIQPVDYNGQFFTEIPFTFVGSENNDACMDNIPLYDLAVVNLGHYRNSADVEETSYVAGQAVPLINIGETDEMTFKQLNPNGVSIGSRKGLIVGAGGDFNFRQVSPNLLPRELMTDKEGQATAIGARLIAPSGGRETAEAARIRYGAQNSALYVITKNVSEAIEECLYFCSVFMSETPEESLFELNDRFYDDTADPNVIAQQIMLFDRGLMTPSEIREGLADVGMIKKDAIEEYNDSDVINPLANVQDSEIDNDDQE